MAPARNLIRSPARLNLARIASKPPIRDRRRLARQAADALVAWRRKWEREFCSAPSEGMGQGDELRMWRVAGRLMAARGIRSRFA
ncbi:MAG TPA: hypothetical protein VGF89_01140 [Steroidobacteraceae bacterium]|jgi:hypothetical protein